MLQSTYPSIKTIHYLTDSPTSQYRNKTIFKILADHNEDFGIAGRWNYLESGHDKGPCDGLGASIKRAADTAICQGKCFIQNVEDLYAWSKQTEESGSKIKYLYYIQADVDMSSEIIQQKEKPILISGTFKLYAIVPINSCTILTRETLCYCNGCLQEQVICKRQDEEDIDKNGTLVPTLEVAAVTSDQKEMFEYERIQYSEIQPSHWVSAVYEQNFYFGHIVAIDIDDDEVEPNFLEKSGKYGKAFNIPSREDKLWIKREILLTILEKEPRPVGKAQKIKCT
ncbi:hypothetical protein ACJMK2_007766 [Sinanodonta woodiana]|uniref:Uncharacterized protein n=1 Tax=Sinanodonta woodiana TaxID=1069815 RepID=A0ABD3VLZ8_SINWO